MAFLLCFCCCCFFSFKHLINTWLISYRPNGFLSAVVFGVFPLSLNASLPPSTSLLLLISSVWFLWKHTFHIHFRLCFSIEKKKKKKAIYCISLSSMEQRLRHLQPPIWYCLTQSGLGSNLFLCRGTWMFLIFAVRGRFSLYSRYLTAMIFVASKVGCGIHSKSSELVMRGCCRKLHFPEATRHLQSLSVGVQSVWASVRSGGHCYSTCRCKLYSANKNHLFQSALTIR